MAPKTIELKMAKPSQQDFECVHDFLQGIETIIEDDLIPEQGDGESGTLATEDRTVEWMTTQWRRVRRSWSRVLWAGKTAIDNCCDPNANVLEWKPEIVEMQKVLADLTDHDPCSLDHHGHCQGHMWFGEGECPHARAKRLLGEKP